MEWPADNKPADFDNLVKPIRNAILFSYNVERKNRELDIPLLWFGK